MPARKPPTIPFDDQISPLAEQTPVQADPSTTPPAPAHPRNRSSETEQGQAAPLVVVVEDDQATAAMLAELLSSAGYRSLLLARGKDAHVAIRNAKPDLVILDLWLEHRDAGDMVLGLLGLDPGTRHIPVIVCSAHVDVLRDRAPELRRYGYVLLEKPFQAKELLAAIESLLARVGNRGGPEHG